MHACKIIAKPISPRDVHITIIIRDIGDIAVMDIIAIKDPDKDTPDSSHLIAVSNQLPGILSQTGPNAGWICCNWLGKPSEASAFFSKWESKIP